MRLRIVTSRAVPVLLGAALLVAPMTQAQAGTSVLYVNGGSASCSDSGAGSPDQPFCSIQAAANVVNPGQTVEITGAVSIRYAPVTVTRSGTAAEPITFTSATPGTIMPQVASTADQPAITIDGVSHVIISYLIAEYWGSGGGIDVTGSQAVTLDRLTAIEENEDKAALSSPPGGITVDGASSQVTVSRSQTFTHLGYGVRLEAGAQNITVSTNYISASTTSTTVNPAGGLALDSVTPADITSNSIDVSCGQALAITGSTSAEVENNYLGSAPNSSCPAPGAALSADASAAQAMHEDYNALFAAAPAAEYSWAGTTYTSASAFAAATGQATHDQDASRQPTRGAPAAGSAQIDSADCSAGGELTTDLHGNAHVKDPLVTQTGTGSCYADRGAVELEDPIALTYTGLTNGIVPVTSTIQITSGATSPWSEAVSYSADFGDGAAPVPVPAGGTVPHTYTIPGIYFPSITASDTGGSSVSRVQKVVVGTVSPPAEGLTAGPWLFSTSSFSGIISDAAAFTMTPGPDSWEVASITLAFGDGTSSGIGPQQTSWDHVYPHPGTYTATLTVTDLLGRQTTSSAAITVGDEFLHVQPRADLGSGPDGSFLIHPYKTLKLPAQQLDGDSFTAAVKLVARITNPAAAGTLTVYPDGTQRPADPALAFRRGQAASNEVLATLGPNDTADFYNGSAKTIELGLMTTALEESGGESGDTYVPVAPAQVLDTGAHAVPAGGDVTFSVAGAGVASSADQVVLDVTATHTTASGSAVLWSKARTDIYTHPRQPYWSSRQTVTSLVTVPVNGSYVTLHNSSKGSADFMVDVVGYYAFFGNQAIFLPDRTTLTGSTTRTIGAGRTLHLRIPGCDGAPVTDIPAVAVNLVASGSAHGGYLSPVGSASRYLSFGAYQTAANAAIIRLRSDGTIALHNAGPRAVNVRVWLNGCYYRYPASP